MDEFGNFYLSSKSTCLHQNRLRTATAVKAKDIHGWMSTCKSKRQALILDCCNAGAFAKGLTAKDAGNVDIQTQLGGEGRAVLTASTSTQYAFEKEGLDLSNYTHYLVEGLEKGAADLDGDGQISVEELHEYVFKKVKEAAPAMTPEFYNFARATEPILLARSPKDDPKLKYRKEVEKRLDQGQFSITARKLLNRKRAELGIDLNTAELIEAEVLQPLREREHNLQDYRETLEAELKKQNPLSARTQRELQDYQQALGLRDQDIAPIHTKLSVLPVSPETIAIGAKLSDATIAIGAKLSDAYKQAEYKQAERAYMLGSYEEAATIINRVAEHYPTDLNVHLLKGHIYCYGLQRFDIAKEQYQSVLSLTTDSEYIASANKGLADADKFSHDTSIGISESKS